jgi:hypothetical protein
MEFCFMLYMYIIAIQVEFPHNFYIQKEWFFPQDKRNTFILLFYSFAGDKVEKNLPTIPIQSSMEFQATKIYVKSL